MPVQSSVEVARMLIERHGLRAAAVAEEHAAEAQNAGDTASLGHWRSVQLAVSELRRTAPKSDTSSLN